MDKEFIKSLGIEVSDEEELSEEQAQELIKNKLAEKDEHINNLESEKETLSKSNEELSASVEGLKADKEKLDKELSEKNGRLSQITEMYKEQFTRDPEKQEDVKDEQELHDDVLQQILDTR